MGVGTDPLIIVQVRVRVVVRMEADVRENSGGIRWARTARDPKGESGRGRSCLEYAVKQIFASVRFRKVMGLTVSMVVL